jgi:hypothetical protein
MVEGVFFVNLHQPAVKVQVSYHGVLDYLFGSEGFDGEKAGHICTSFLLLSTSISFNASSYSGLMILPVPLHFP